MEVPNKNRTHPSLEMMPFKKFAEKEGYIYNDTTVKINGAFKEKGSDKIIRGDIFEAHELSGQSIEEIYKVYLTWFNYTKLAHEKEREFVSVKQVKESDE